MWRAIRRTDGKVVYQDRKRDEVLRWIRWNGAGFFVDVDFVHQ